MAQEQTEPTPTLHVAPGPHFGSSGRSTRSMMYDVALALLPAVAMSFYVFGSDAGRVIGLTIISCMATEAIFQIIRGRRVSLPDGSAMVTGLILALSLPWTAPWWMPVIGGVVAVGIGKMVFGGLGDNLFNPAMVGRAFLMICFTTQMTTWLMDTNVPPPNAVWLTPAAEAADVAGAAPATPDATTGATPLESKVTYAWSHMMVGNINGCLGETSALALLLGGIYLCLRRTAAWQIPIGVLGGAMIIAFIHAGLNPDAVLKPGHHLLGGALMFGAFFIATDPVSSPVSPMGRWVFAIGLGALTMIIRLYAAYPEGMMFAVLLMNALTPMINRWTIPVPVGGKPKS